MKIFPEEMRLMQLLQWMNWLRYGAERLREHVFDQIILALCLNDAQLLEESHKIEDHADRLDWMADQLYAVLP